MASELAVYFAAYYCGTFVLGSDLTDLLAGGTAAIEERKKWNLLVCFL